MPDTLKFFLAFVVVLALIGATAWLIRRFAGNKLGAGGNSSRMPRLAVIDAAAVDNRRRLVLIRRDNVEHLVMIGGPADIVVETNISRGQPQREAPAQRTPAGTDLPPRIAPLPDASGWDGDDDHFDQPNLAPEPPRRGASERHVSDPFADFAPEPAIREPVRAERSEPVRMDRAPRIEPRAEPRLPRAADLAARPAQSRPSPRQSEISADQNLAEMANRLEAALRRPGAENGDARTPQINQMDRVGAPPVAPEPVTANRPPRGEAETGKQPFQSLEDEMASLLGRPKNLK